MLTYKNCSQKTSGLKLPHQRHSRVNSWTRNVDIFSKDFVFVPVNQCSHWFLAVICFPGLQEKEMAKEGCRPCIYVLDSIRGPSYKNVATMLLPLQEWLLHQAVQVPPCWLCMRGGALQEWLPR
ncbi:uncharacterized protein LOC133350993 [Lethenteron reissneri]|uniref:uncharacterized protein LOC133350993 n=1 Tax=Lethenteron reissneri TaxID=7753 RepID=UPI002AB6E5E3|nr:uncharacterized protein LOC133350993 [Lethenteron reissneri]